MYISLIYIPCLSVLDTFVYSGSGEVTSLELQQKGHPIVSVVVMTEFYYILFIKIFCLLILSIYNSNGNYVIETVFRDEK